MGMPGSGSGPGKRAGRNPGTAPRADFHRPEAAALVEFIDAHRDRFGVEPACAVLEFPVSSYYHAKKREAEPSAREIRDVILKEKIMDVWEGEKGRKVYGARKIWLQLNSGGIPVARCTVERLMREPGDPRCQPRAEEAADDAARRSRGPAV